ncbi:cytochrome c [Marinihelvus fidelis]|uniref:Cytochrome c n=1 Tax=Marinihelvus fidelis TaxID=2613842 RepID=A0A5N0T7Q8_9GAMM|nr:cytochrome c [Marinihelvus fidelis]KAA9130811.1 cytochrome c [Marinihelvus fidelis]
MKRTCITLAIMAIASAGTALAADPEAGKAKSATCVACHGADGISPNPLWPNLAGQKDQYLVKQMKAFRDGDRKDPLMTPMAAGLSDEDIANLAAYYSGL